MSNTSQVSINQLPMVLLTVPFYVTVILNSDNSLNQATVQSSGTYILYGNAKVDFDGFNPYFIARDNNPIAIAVTSTFLGITYFNILYTKAIYGQQNPDNFRSIIQKIPLGIFDDLTTYSLVGKIFAAKANMLDDYYKQYFYVQSQVYAESYSPQLEYEYNQTHGLLQNSFDVNGLFHLLSSSNIVALNTYDLELFITKYIYYRIGASCAVYINDNVKPISQFWILGSSTQSVLDSTTILAGDNDTPAIANLAWTIFNSSATNFTTVFQDEITALILRMSRADIGNTVSFNTSLSPVIAGGFTAIGSTYPNDPRMLYGKCLVYLGDSNYPLNIYGYVTT